MKSKQRILFGCYAMVLAIIGDYLLGWLSFGSLVTFTGLLINMPKERK